MTTAAFPRVEAAGKARTETRLTQPCGRRCLCRDSSNLCSAHMDQAHALGLGRVNLAFFAARIAEITAANVRLLLYVRLARIEKDLR